MLSLTASSVRPSMVITPLSSNLLFALPVRPTSPLSNSLFGSSGKTSSLLARSGAPAGPSRFSASTEGPMRWRLANRRRLPQGRPPRRRDFGRNPSRWPPAEPPPKGIQGCPPRGRTPRAGPARSRAPTAEWPKSNSPWRRWGVERSRLLGKTGRAEQPLPDAAFTPCPGWTAPVL